MRVGLRQRGSVLVRDPFTRLKPGAPHRASHPWFTRDAGSVMGSLRSVMAKAMTYRAGCSHRASHPWFTRDAGSVTGSLRSVMAKAMTYRAMTYRAGCSHRCAASGAGAKAHLFLGFLTPA